jgi:hypothetical protein
VIWRPVLIGLIAASLVGTALAQNGEPTRDQGARTTSANSLSSDDYAIYSVAINDVLLKDVSFHFSDSSQHQIVLQKTTSGGIPPGAAGMTGMPDKQTDKIRSEAKGELWDTFVAINHNPETLDSAGFATAVKCRLVAAAELNKFFASPNEGSWEAFYKAYPGAQGITFLSRLGFSKDGMRALLYMGTMSSPVGGIGRLVMFTRTGKNWKVSLSGITWVS